jgi:hypothetical protein
VKVGKKRKKTQLVVQVFFADTGAMKSQFPSPFQRPAFKDIQVSVRDTNGDGVADQIMVSARNGKRTVTQTFSA